MNNGLCTSPRLSLLPSAWGAGPGATVPALDFGDANAGDVVEPVRFQVLDVVELGELAAVIGRGVLLEILHGLPAEVPSIDQEKAPGGPRRT
jgi:hypothetical protein